MVIKRIAIVLSCLFVCSCQIFAGEMDAKYFLEAIGGKLQSKAENNYELTRPVFMVDQPVFLPQLLSYILMIECKSYAKSVAEKNNDDELNNMIDQLTTYISNMEKESINPIVNNNHGGWIPTGSQITITPVIKNKEFTNKIAYDLSKNSKNDYEKSLCVAYTHLKDNLELGLTMGNFLTIVKLKTVHCELGLSTEPVEAAETQNK